MRLTGEGKSNLINHNHKTLKNVGTKKLIICLNNKKTQKNNYKCTIDYLSLNVKLF